MLVKASIIIPVYNAQNTIRRAIDSAVNQTTDESYEVILTVVISTPRQMRS